MRDEKVADQRQACTNSRKVESTYEASSDHGLLTHERQPPLQTADELAEGVSRID